MLVFEAKGHDEIILGESGAQDDRGPKIESCGHQDLEAE